MIDTLTRAFRSSNGAPQPAKCCPPGGPSDIGASGAGACGPSAMPFGFRTGIVPVVMKMCADDEAMQLGRTPTVQVPEYAVWDLVGRAATFSPRTPLQNAATKGVGALDLTITLPAAAPATDQGNKYLFPAFLFEIMTNNNVSPGVTQIEITATFEDGQPWLQTVQFSQGHVGVSRFIVMSTRTEQGGSYPCLFDVERDLQLQDVAQVTTLTAGVAPNDASSFVATNGIRGPNRPFGLSVEVGNINTNYRVELLTPVGRFWNWMVAQLANGIQGNGG